MSQESTVGGWKQVEIGSLVSDVETRNPSSFESDTFEYIDISAVDQDLKTIVGARSINCNDAPSRARQLINTNDILVSTVRPNLNAVAIVPEVFDTAIASTGFCVLRPKQKQLDASYLFQWVKTPLFVSDMMRKATGASYPAVSDRIIFESKLPLPPLPEQRRIAAILDKAEALRAKRRAALAKLDQLAQSIFLEMFGDPATNPKRFSKVELSTLVRVGDNINYGVVQPGDDLDEGVPLIRVGDITDGSIKTGNIKRISPEIENSYKRSRLNGDEILVSCVGSIGSVALANSSVAGYNIARAVARIPPSNDVNRQYLAAYLRTKHIQQYFSGELRTVSQPTLNIKQLSKAMVILPPLPLQQAFAHRIEKLESLKTAHRASLAKLDALFASLQDRAFRGEL